MSEEFVLDAEIRDAAGKGSSRRLRRLEGKLPAIIYGGKNAEPQAITLAQNDMSKAISNEAFFSHIITLNVAGKAQQVIIKDLQRHPSKSYLLHADFQRVSKDVAIHVHVPLHFVNEESAVGVKQGGGVVTHIMAEVEISCLPGDLPEYIEVDLKDVQLDQIVHLSDLKLPKGVALLHPPVDDDHNLAVVSIHAPRRGVAEEESSEESSSEEAGDKE